eukprot:441495-Rhodomonas_salina.3
MDWDAVGSHDLVVYHRAPIALRLCYAVSGTDKRLCCAVSGTDVRFCYALSGTDIGHLGTRGIRSLT